MLKAYSGGKDNPIDPTYVHLSVADLKELRHRIDVILNEPTPPTNPFLRRNVRRIIK